MDKVYILTKRKLRTSLVVRVVLVAALLLCLVAPIKNVWAPYLPAAERDIITLRDKLEYVRFKLNVQQKILTYYRDMHRLTLTATAYTARVEECDPTPEVTAIMETPTPGWTVAVSHDLKHWLGKQVYIYGLGVRRVNDLMNERYEQSIDILVPSVSKARAFGKQDLEVVLLEPREYK